MLKYAKIINEETKQCEVGLGTNAEYYESIGMTEMDVEEAYTGDWYVAGYAPEKPAPTYEEQKQARANAYREEVDPITAHIERLKDAEQTEETIEKIKENGDYEYLVASFMPYDGQIVVPADIELTGDKTLKLGTNAAFPPFEYVDGSKIVGFDITMGQKIAFDAGAKLEVVDMAFDSLIPALASGAIDFIAAGMSVTEERQKNVDFSLPYFESEQVIIIRK